MLNLLFLAAMAAFLAGGSILLNLALFAAYKVAGGRKSLIPYMKKYL